MNKKVAYLLIAIQFTVSLVITLGFSLICIKHENRIETLEIELKEAKHYQWERDNYTINLMNTNNKILEKNDNQLQDRIVVLEDQMEILIEFK